MNIITPIKKQAVKTCCLAMLLISSKIAYAENLLVITHKNNDVPNLTKQQTVNIFMGGANQYGLTPISLSSGNKHTREKFNTFVIGLTESRIRSYWAQMQFSGRGKAPASIESQQELIDMVSAETHYIGYILDDTDLPENVKVVFSIETNIQ